MIRFLLLTDPRSGTMMLTDTLSKHSEIKWFNLYASNPDNPSRHYQNWVQKQDACNGWIGTTMHRVPEGWLRVFSPVPSTEFWQTLQRRHNRWILLHRENILRQWLSKQVGIILCTYKVSEPRPKDPGPVRVHIQEFMTYVSDTLRLRDTIDQFFPEALVMTYERLAQDWDKEFTNIQEYLGLPPLKTDPVTVRQETRPLEEAIENYDEVKLYLSNQGYGAWFE